MNVTRTSEPAPVRPQAEPPPDKQVIRLPDGRELTYYRFDPPARGRRSPDQAQGNRGSSDEKER